MKTLFDIVEPRDELKNLIIKSIKVEERKKTIRNMVFSSVVSLASISMAVIFVINIIKDAYQSGLSEYLSLLISDSSSVLSYWKVYTMSIVESLPILQITILFASIWVFVWSMNIIINNLKSSKLVFYKIS